MANRKTVMVVDDDPDILKTMDILLGREYAVIAASDGDAALSILAKQRPQLLILDVSMPKMSGLEVLKSVHASLPALAVLMLTAEMDLDVAKRALECGATAYITKPFEYDALLVEVKRLLETPAADDDEKNYRPWRVKP
ncbi:MAG: response regulator [Elusimicrobiota bacterium]|jgi:DNA-binding NtrC family response regulator